MDFTAGLMPLDTALAQMLDRQRPAGAGAGGVDPRLPRL
ncbi:hypothetical protein ACLBPK_06070, partial [Klebsiella pneumoniae]